MPLLKGVDEAVLDSGKLWGHLSGVTKALELVGPKTLYEKNLCPCVGAEYDFSEIKEACMALDSGNVNGKIVINVAG